MRWRLPWVACTPPRGGRCMATSGQPCVRWQSACCACRARLQDLNPPLSRWGPCCRASGTALWMDAWTSAGRCVSTAARLAGKTQLTLILARRLSGAWWSLCAAPRLAVVERTGPLADLTDQQLRRLPQSLGNRRSVKISRQLLLLSRLLQVVPRGTRARGLVATPTSRSLGPTGTVTAPVQPANLTRLRRMPWWTRSFRRKEMSLCASCDHGGWRGAVKGGRASILHFDSGWRDSRVSARPA